MITDPIQRQFGAGPLGLAIGRLPRPPKQGLLSLGDGLSEVWFELSHPSGDRPTLARRAIPCLAAVAVLWGVLAFVQSPPPDEAPVSIVAFEEPPAIIEPVVEVPPPPPPVEEPAPPPPPPVAKVEPPKPPPPAKPEPPKPLPKPKPIQPPVIARPKPILAPPPSLAEQKPPPPPPPRRELPRPAMPKPELPKLALDAPLEPVDREPQAFARAEVVKRPSLAPAQFRPDLAPLESAPQEREAFEPVRERASLAARPVPAAALPRPRFAPLAPPPTAAMGEPDRQPPPPSRALAPRPGATAVAGPPRPADLFAAPAAPAPSEPAAPSPSPVRAPVVVARNASSSGSRRDRKLRGVPLGSLPACRSDQQEDVLKSRVIRAVTTQAECVSGAGHYRFIETRNLNAFLMTVERAEGRGSADRCAELELALECLAQARAVGG